MKTLHTSAKVLALLQLLLLGQYAYAIGPHNYGSVWGLGASDEQVQAAIPGLLQSGTSMIYAMDAKKLDEPGYMQKFLNWEAQGLQLIISVHIGGEHEWASDINADQVRADTIAIADAIVTSGLQTRWLYIDNETSLAGSQELIQKQAAGDILGIINFFRNYRHGNRYAYAKTVYNDMIAQVKSKGFNIGVSTIPTALDDYIDGDRGLHQGAGWMLQGINWDRITFQVYRTVYDANSLVQGLGGSTPHVVYSYAKEAVRQFGSDRAGLDLGITVNDPFTNSQGYSPEELLADVSAALAAGVKPENLNVFSLPGYVVLPDPENNVSEEEATNRTADLAARFYAPTQANKPPFALSTIGIRAAQWALDVAVSEIYGSADAYLADYDQIYMSHVGKCLQANGTGNGANIVAVPCSLANTQRWYQSNDGLIHLAANQNMCIDVSDGWIHWPGKDIWLWQCNGSAAQKFSKPRLNDAGRFRVQHNIGMCVDIKDWGISNEIEMNTCRDDAIAAQYFSFRQERVDQFRGLRNKGTGMCLDASTPHLHDGKTTHMWNCAYHADWHRWFYNGDTQKLHVKQNASFCLDNFGQSSGRPNVYRCVESKNLQWNFSYNDDGSFTIHNSHNTNRVLASYGSYDGAPMEQADFIEGNLNQTWEWVTPTHYRPLINVNTGDCLDGTGVTNLNKVQAWPCHGGQNQRWQSVDGGKLRSLKNPAKCAAHPDGYPAVGLKAKIWDCSINQHLVLTENGLLRAKNGSGEWLLLEQKPNRDVEFIADTSENRERPSAYWQWGN